jgi:serine phosphatase RsbU (regulator of sigma subunit)
VKKSGFIYFVFLLFPLWLFSETIPIIIQSEQQQIFPLFNHLEVLTTQDDLSAEQIFLGKTQFKKYNRAKGLNFGFYAGNVWLRFKMENETEDMCNLLYAIKYSLINYIDFYVFDGSRLIKQYHTGDRRKFNTRDVKNRNFLFLLKIKPQHHYTYLVRIKNNGETLRIPMELTQQKQYIEEEIGRLVLMGLFYGLFFFVIIFHLFLYFTIKESIYWVYSVFVFFFALFLASVDGLTYQYFWPSFPYWHNVMVVFSVAMASFTLLVFADKFMGLKKNGSAQLRITYTVAEGLFLLIAGMSFINELYLLSMKLVNAFALIAIVFMIYLSMRQRMQKNSYAIYFLYAFFMFMVGVIIYVLRNFGVLPDNILATYSLKSGVAIEVVLLAFAVSDRFKRIKEEANTRLEQKVRNRTEMIQQQNSELEAQRDLAILQKQKLEQKSHEIKASIDYAQRLQQAIMLSERELSIIHPQLFLYYKPKDIISGDFYWAKKVNNKKIFIIADATGHGVPGALMSMLGLSFMNDIIVQQEVLEPHKILEEIRLRTVSIFRQTGRIGESKDGLDLSVCVIDDNEDITDNVVRVQFASANQKIYVKRKDENKILEIKGDRMPIGIYHKSYLETQFSKYEFSLSSGDFIYMFSDGISDQFGGDECRKLKHRGLQEILLDITKLPIEYQKKQFVDRMMRWQNLCEQVDDMLLLGLEI